MIHYILVDIEDFRRNLLEAEGKEAEPKERSADFFGGCAKNRKKGQGKTQVTFYKGILNRLDASGTWNPPRSGRDCSKGRQHLRRGIDEEA